jgi:3-methyladenine DNA glycosylase AlkD
MSKQADALHALFARHADATRAPAMTAYMKGQFEYFGIGTPQRRALTREWLADFGRRPESALLLEVSEALWRFPERECQYAACDLLAHHAVTLEPEFLERLARLADTKPWWDTIDTLAAKVFGTLARTHPELVETIAGWESADSLWRRRVAILYQLGYGSATDTQRMARILDANLDDRDFFIRKAIGWALRQYARTDPAWVRAYLASRSSRLSPLSHREAAKHLGDQA